jgi:uncharacterized protein (DUF1501 family)
VQLYGGNDGFNTLVHFDDDAYHRARPNLALKKSATLPLDASRGLHAKLPHLRAWWDRGAVAIVEGVGSSATSLSHFQSEAVWEAGGRAAARARTGWIGRLVDARIERGLDEASPVAMVAVGRDVLPASMRAARVTPPAIPDLGEFTRARPKCALDDVAVADGASSADRRLYACDRTLRAALSARERLADAARARPLVDYPGTEIGRNLEAVGLILRAHLGTRVVYTTMQSFDTHAFQRDDHTRLLAELDDGLNALLWDLDAQGALDRTLVLTVSEFGRRLAENGVGNECGTDHGRASILLALGGVAGGILGERPSFSDLDEDGNVRAHVDFMRVYATAIERWFGADVETVLGARHAPLDFVGG